MVDLKPKTLRLERGDIQIRTRGDLTAVVWRDQTEVSLVTNIHNPPREGNYRDEHGKVLKPTTVADFNRQMGMLTMQIRWPIAARPAFEHGSGQENSFPNCLTWPLSTVISFYLNVMGRKSHTVIFDSPLSERCWHGLGMSHGHPYL